MRALHGRGARVGTASVSPSVGFGSARSISGLPWVAMTWIALRAARGRGRSAVQRHVVGCVGRAAVGTGLPTHARRTPRDVRWAAPGTGRHPQAQWPDMTRPALLDVHELVKTYGETRVVDGVSFSIAPGECLGIIGPNGAGKTTTLRACLGLTAPDGGHIRYFAKDDGQALHMPRDALAIKARLGVVTQFDSLDPDFSCAENLIEFGRYFGLPRAELAQRVPPLLEFAALTHKADAKPGELSGGMKRRLSLARALVNNPDLLLLDEPTTGLDPQARHLMWERLQMLLANGKSILLTTHFMDEAERLCHRLLVLDRGRKIAEGRPRELIAQHLEPEVVEAYGPGAAALAGSALAAHAERVEQSGDTVFFYTHNAHALLQALQAHPQLRTLHRPANLEDLFLKLTGRQIREDG